MLNSYENSETAKLYKTGDLAKFIDHTTLHYEGRVDEQIKLNGYRIELGEIEAILSGMNGIQNVVASIEIKNNNKQINVYLSMKDKSCLPKLTELKNIA